MLVSQWDQYAGSWTGQSLPLRPCSDDLRNYREAISLANSPPIYEDLMILGVTPEIYHLGTMMGFSPRGLDYSESMINSIWPGPLASAAHGDWREIDQSAERPGILVCDGGLHLLSFEDQIRFVKCFRSGPLSLSSIVFRLFLPLTQQKSNTEILDEFEASQYLNISYLKVALWHSVDIQKAGVTQIQDVWKAVYRRAQGDVIGYLTSLGQSREAIDSFLVYRNSSASYYFHSLPRIHEMMSNLAGFKPMNVFTPTYPEGRSFPVVIYSQH